MSCDTYFPTSPDDVYEEPIEIPRDTDLPVTVTAREEDDDCDPATKPDEYDFTGHTVVLEVFDHKDDDTPVFTQANTDWTITQNQNGIDEGVNNQLKTTLMWADLTDIELGIEHWYRVFVTDAAGTSFVPQRGPFLKSRY